MAMQKVDAVIAGVGAFALLATVLGVVFYEELAGEQDITFPTAEDELTAQQGNQGTRFDFDLPDNATGALLDVTVQFTGTSGQGGQANIQVEITGPDNFRMTHDETMQVAQAGGTTADKTFQVPFFNWTAAPAPETGDPAAVDRTMEWSTPLTVTVRVTGPSDNLGVIPSGPVSYTYTTVVTPTVTYFFESVAAPEPATA